MKTYIITDSLGEKHRIQAPTIEKAVDKYNRTLVRDAKQQFKSLTYIKYKKDNGTIVEKGSVQGRPLSEFTVEDINNDIQEGYIKEVIDYKGTLIKDSLTRDATMEEAWFDRIKASDLKEIKDFDLILVKKDSGSALLRGKKEDLLEFADYIGIDIDIL